MTYFYIYFRYHTTSYIKYHMDYHVAGTETLLYGILKLHTQMYQNTMWTTIWFDACLENSKDGRIDVFQNTVWLLKELVKWTNKQPG